MSKCLAVVAFVLLVLSGATGLRNIAAMHSASSSGTVLLAQGRPMPGTGSGGGHVQGRPMPGTGSGGGHIQGRPMPGTGSGGGHVQGRPMPGTGSGGGH